MAAIFTAIKNSPAAVRRLFSAPDTAASTISTTVPLDPAAPEDQEGSPRAPTSSLNGAEDDRCRPTDLEGGVARYQDLMDNVNDYVAAQQASHDVALALSQAQVGQPQARQFCKGKERKV